jgi:hypothetical protein
MDVVTQGKTKAGTYRSKDLDLSRVLEPCITSLQADSLAYNLSALRVPTRISCQLAYAAKNRLIGRDGSRLLLVSRGL